MTEMTEMIETKRAATHHFAAGDSTLADFDAANHDAGIMYTLVPSPMGDVLLAGNDAFITELYLQSEEMVLRRGIRPGPGAHPLLKEAKSQLQAYFAGKRRGFDLPLAPRGTPFQKRVWQALREIPYGQTISYRTLAERVGIPRGPRAVGQANGANPISIIVPCHRVIAADNGLGGYGGGLARKRWLLTLEGAHFSGMSTHTQ